MPLNPTFLGPDLQYREIFNFSTTSAYRFFEGTMDPDTVDMQVSIRGSSFTSDPDLIYFEGSSFTIPNPAAFPEGLNLFAGDNEILVKSILTNGTVTASSSINARLSQEDDILSTLTAPSGISIERFDRVVTTSVVGLDDENVQGYNFYCATSPGGGTAGYSRINPSLTISSATEEAFTALGELTVDASIKTNLDGSPAADPLFMVYRGTQEDNVEEILQTDFYTVIEISELVSKLRTSLVLESVSEIQKFSFTHDRQSSFNSTLNPAIPNAAFSAIPTGDPLYYVITAIYYLNGVEYESTFSPEVSGAPLLITPQVGTLPTVSRQQITRDTVLSIFRSSPQVDVKPGSVIRDTFLDPFSSEAERLRFIIGFLHDAQSFSTLLPIDDPGFTGSSIPINQSPYKQALKLALYLDSDTATQAVIDGSFDKLGSNYGKSRRPGARSKGSVTLFTKVRPNTDLNFPLGQRITLGGVNFLLTSPASISTAGAGSFFDPTTGRYSTTAFIQAEVSGLTGNIAPSIGTVERAPLGVQVQNEAPTFGGKGEETNRELALRAQGALSAVDSGTMQGYTETAIEVAGVSQVNVIDADHTLMARDVNSAGTHIGGKVDIWVRGESLGTVTDTFAFTFEIKTEAQFEVVGDIQNLIFRAVDSNLTVENPLIEMLEIDVYAIYFKNVTKGYNFDLTNVTYLTYNTIQLDSSLNDPTDIYLQDELRGSYRYRTSNNYVFTRQPVRELVSFVGQESGTLDSSVYELFKLEDPLLLGYSSEANDYIQVDSPTITVPSPNPLSVINENHVILDGVEYLNNLGANPLTVKVFNSDRTVEYDSPYTLTPDYTFIPGNATTALGIQTTAGTAIVEGQTILIDYSHDENFTVSYIPNVLLGVVQQAVNQTRHITADVLIKEATPIPTDLTFVVVLQNSNDRTVTINQVDALIRTALAQFFGALSIGEPVRPSDIIRIVDGVDGVSYVITPLSKMVKGEDALILRESLLSSQNSDSLQITAWSTSQVTTWLLKNPLTASTINSGGPSNYFRMVHKDEGVLNYYDVAPNVGGLPLNSASGGCFIIGETGLNIPGYTDDATLEATYIFDTNPDLKATQLVAKRKELTQNRVLLSLEPSEHPQEAAYTATYIVAEGEGVKNVDPGAIGFLTLGNIEITYDQDYDYKSRVLGRSV